MITNEQAENVTKELKRAGRWITWNSDYLVKKMLKMKEENKETKIELYISDNEKIIITLNTTIEI